MRTKIIFAAIAALMFAACNSEIEKPSIVIGDQTPLDVDASKAISKNNRIIYELNLYNFTQEGTFKAAEALLPDLQKLGVDIIWLMPVYARCQNEQKIDEVGSPYSVQNFLALNPDFGTMDDLKAFISTAHSLGIKIWFDWVANHTSTDNVWVTAHPDYYIQKDGKPDIVRNADGGEIYPDVYQLDFANAQMCKDMIDAMKYWVTECGIDGYRFDYVSSWRIVTTDFWGEALKALHELKPDIETIAEADLSDSSNQKLIALQPGFDYDFMMGMQGTIRELGKADAVSGLQNKAEGVYSSTLFDNMSRMFYITDHDDYNGTQTTYSALLGEGNYAPLDVLSFTFYGMPLLYNGQEIGYPKVESFFSRKPIDRTLADKRIQNTVRTLAYLRHTCPALADGKASERATMKMLQTNPAATSMAYLKEKDGQTILVVLNFGKEQSVYTYMTPEGEYTQVLDSRTISEGPSQRDVTITGAPKGVCEFPMDKKGYAVYIKK